MEIEILAGEYAVCQIPKGQSMAPPKDRGGFWSVTETDEEVSLICRVDRIPETLQKETGWCVTRIRGVLDFSLVGVLLKVIQPLADRGISIFTVSTYNTDYILLKEECLEEAVQAWNEQGYHVRRESHD